MVLLEEYICNNILKVRVKPSARKTEVLGFNAARGCVEIALKAPPRDGEANKELIKFLTKTLKKKILIKSGLTSREKILVVN